MPRKRYIHSIKPVDITEYNVHNAHHLVGEMRDVVVKYRELDKQLEDLRKHSKKPVARYRMSCHFVAGNEFYFLLRIDNAQDFEDYIQYWTKGPVPEEVIHSITYYAVVDGDSVGLIDGVRGIGVLTAPMHISLDDYTRFKRTQKPFSGWILDNVRNRCVAGIDYSDREILDDRHTEVQVADGIPSNDTA